MEMDNRPSADSLLKKIQAEETRDSGRGHLKIFFGYAAGVGKTYAMLEAAHAAKDRGIDTVVGYIEPHTRPDTMALLEGLEVLPPKKVSYHGITLNEFDIDAALKRKPSLILVDELAHTNAEGCRHLKRYQDVQELLKAGIDVYTTVNVQHLESLNDKVAAITGVTVRERIPDSVFDEADQVELVDIEPDDLIARLKEGRIYRPEQAGKALVNFFTEGNLIALREIALRRTADRVNYTSEKNKTVSVKGERAGEHILVCLSSSPTNARIIRTASRIANAFGGSLTALYVNTPSSSTMNAEDKSRLQASIRLARTLGASIESVQGSDIATAISEFARVSGITKIVLGRSAGGSGRFHLKPPLTEQLSELAGNIDIYIIPDGSSKTKKKLSHIKVGKPSLRNAGPDSLKTLITVGGSTLVGTLFSYLGFGDVSIVTIYILGILINSLWTSGKLFSILSSVLSVLAFNFFFTHPRFTFNAYDPGYPITFIIMLISGLITSSLTVKIKSSARDSAVTAYRTRLLFDMNRLLQSADCSEAIADVTGMQLRRLLSKDIVFYNAGDDGKLLPPKVYPFDESVDTSALIAPDEQAVAAWTYKNNTRAGATTDTLSSSACLYLAVRVNESVYGVVGIAVKSGDSIPDFDYELMLSMIGECALALEKEHFLREREQASTLARNEQLKANLLRSISHDLRTPLTNISGSASVLLSDDGLLSPEKRRSLAEGIYNDSMWLINLVENLLSVTRIGNGSMSLRKNTEAMGEVIEEAVSHVSKMLKNHTLKVIPCDDVLLADMDARLIVQVIINLVDNAVKYSPEKTEITISSGYKGKDIYVSVADQGEGVRDDEKDKIFDMFYTSHNEISDSRRSLGLGLALVKTIIQAHGGTISVKDNHPVGSIFTFTLPGKEIKVDE